jgi:hypothetical protein
MKENGNIKSNALYNPDEIRHPPPTIMTDSERDSELEIYIRGDLSIASQLIYSDPIVYVQTSMSTEDLLAGQGLSLLISGLRDLYQTCVQNRQLPLLINLSHSLSPLFV